MHITLKNNTLPSTFTNSSKSITSYLKDVRRRSSLTQQENSELAQKVAQGDTQARNRMIEGNLCIVLTAVKSFLGCGLSEEDLVQAGNEGLIEAVDKFDSERGCPFYPYAKACIDGHIKDVLNEEGCAIRVPRTAKVHEDYLYYDLDESGELVERYSSPVRNICSIEERVCNCEDGHSYADILAQDETSYADRLVIDADRRQELEHILHTRYKKKEQQVIRMRLGMDEHPMQVWEIAERLHCTKANVYGILHKICPDAAA